MRTCHYMMGLEGNRIMDHFITVQLNNASDDEPVAELVLAKLRPLYDMVSVDRRRGTPTGHWVQGHLTFQVRTRVLQTRRDVVRKIRRLSRGKIRFTVLSHVGDGRCWGDGGGGRLC